MVSQLAQEVRASTFNRQIAGSSPALGTIINS